MRADATGRPPRRTQLGARALRRALDATRTTGGFSINVHEQAYPYDPTACGDIPKR